MPSDSLIVLGFSLVFVIVVFSIAWHFSRSRQLLEKWVVDNGYQLVHREYRSLRRGPFFWTTSRGQAVYYVVVRDALGKERSGWVRCGSWWLGLSSDKVEVAWED
jgi:hypothetical protein